MDIANLRPLQIFHAVMRFGTVSEAARQLNVTQPAVSKMLKLMEEQAGIELFKRHSGRLYPSRDAEQLFAETERLFGHIQALKDKIGGLRESQEGELVVAAIPTIASSLIAKAIGRFIEGRPKVKFELKAHTSSQVVEAVARQQADMGFVHGPVDDKHFDGEYVWETEVVCLMRKHHPLSRLDVVTVDDLRPHRLITLAPTSPPSWLLKDIIASAGMPGTTKIQTNLSVAAYSLVDAGVGIALIDPLAMLSNSFPNLVLRPFQPKLRIRTACLYSNYRPLSRLSVDFIKEVRAIITDIASISPFISMLPSTRKG